MSVGDGLLTPQTARRLLSWRILVGVAATIVLATLGVGLLPAVTVGIVVYAVSVFVPGSGRTRTRIDPFTLSEPWRRFVQSAERSRRALHETLRRTADGPLKRRLSDVGGRLDDAIEESWQIARRGDEIDAAIKRIDPVRLRGQLETLRSAAASESTDAAAASVESQLASAERLRALSARTADRLRLTQARLDELVARTAEVSVGRTDSTAYTHDVDDLVVELEGLRQAVAETNELP